MRPVEQIEEELGRHIDHIDHSWYNKQLECAWYQRGLEWVIQNYDENALRRRLVELTVSDIQKWQADIQTRAIKWCLQTSKSAKRMADSTESKK